MVEARPGAGSAVDDPAPSGLDEVVDVVYLEDRPEARQRIGGLLPHAGPLPESRGGENRRLDRLRPAKLELVERDADGAESTDHASGLPFEGGDGAGDDRVARIDPLLAQDPDARLDAFPAVEVPGQPTVRLSPAEDLHDERVGQDPLLERLHRGLWAILAAQLQADPVLDRWASSFEELVDCRRGSEHGVASPSPSWLALGAQAGPTSSIRMRLLMRPFDS